MSLCAKPLAWAHPPFGASLARPIPDCDGSIGRRYTKLSKYPAKTGAWTVKKGRYLPFMALRRGDDFGMVPADLRPPYWAGPASFLSVRRIKRPGRGAIQDLRQIR